MASVTGTKTRGGRPLSAYSLFPAFVALWFGALFGLSTLAVGVPNLERAVAALQLHLLIPVAAPPLGMTARALIALALTGLGGAIGFVVGMAIARFNRPVPLRPVAVRERDVHPDAPVRRPISAHEEFGEVEADDHEAVLDMQALRASMAGHDASDEDELDLPAFLTLDEPSPAPADEVTVEEPAVPAAFGLPIGEGAERIASAGLEDLSPVELLERMAIAMQRRLDRRSQAADGESEASTANITTFRATAHIESELAANKSPKETEQALRDALAALQRMTGTH